MKLTNNHNPRERERERVNSFGRLRTSPRLA